MKPDTTNPGPTSLEVLAIQGIGQVIAGDDLAELVLAHLDEPLRAGDVVVVTSKVVSKAAGLVVHGPRTDLFAQETDRVVARRGQTRIVRTHHGLTMAAAGVDESNTPTGTAVRLPPDPDDDARRMRARIAHLTGVEVAVVVTDTAGRPWRNGQTDIAIGAAGISALAPMTGEHDSFGNTLEVTAPAVADEIAAAADLVKGKLTGCPVAVVRGLAVGWLRRADGPGAVALLRPESADLFGLGAVEAVRLAVRRDRPVRGFPAPEPDALEVLVRDATDGMDCAAVSVEALDPGRLEIQVADDASTSTWVQAGALQERLRILAVALGLDVTVHCGSQFREA